MPVILSQRIDSYSDYKDIPFILYHFPKRYRNQVKPGDIFIYYQGDRWKRENRYYFGTGIVGAIEVSADGEDYYAHILDAVKFPVKVPIYKHDEGFYEAIDYDEVRNKETPPWQSSVRPVSYGAFRAIIQASGVECESFERTSIIEKEQDPITVLNTLNQRYKDYSPERRERLINAHIDRGNAVVKSLKKILGPTCQICGTEGFEKRDGDKYIEAHHLTQISLCSAQSLCSDNVILVCPNCHREIHYGKQVIVEDRVSHIYIRLGTKEKLITKNTISYLEKFV